MFASQTLAVTLISLTNKDSNPISNGIKEILSGTISGLVMGILAFLVTLMFGYIRCKFSSFSSFSCWVSIVDYSHLGSNTRFLIPTVLYKLKFDLLLHQVLYHNFNRYFKYLYLLWFSNINVRRCDPCLI